MKVELSVAEQKYKAVLAVIGDGRAIGEVAQAWGVSRQTLHEWLARYEIAGLEGLIDRSHRPRVVSAPDGPRGGGACGDAPQHPHWGPRRLLHELDRRR